MSHLALYHLAYCSLSLVAMLCTYKNELVELRMGAMKTVSYSFNDVMDYKLDSCNSHNFIVIDGLI